MTAVRSVLVIGGGLAGAAVSTLLAGGGVDVDLVEAKPDVSGAGSGITLQGNALRELNRLGVWDEVKEKGYGFDSLGLRAPDPAGTLIVEMPDVRSGGPDLPATVGMPRPELARILLDRAAEAGVDVRLGTTVDRSRAGRRRGRPRRSPTAPPAATTSSSAPTASAPGPGAQLGIDLETKAIGMGIWRAFGPRPESVTRTDLYYGGPAYIAGYCPTGENSLYAYIVEDVAGPQRRSRPTSSWPR